METALVLWESCCVSSLLHGAGTWTEISPSTIRQLNKIQSWYFKLAFQVGPGASSASLLWDSGALDMGLRIYREKILLVLYIRNLEEKTLARQIYEEQKRNKWPDLATETANICQDLKIQDCNITTMNITRYKQLVNNALHYKNEERLRLLGQGKCARILTEDYGKKEYI